MHDIDELASRLAISNRIAQYAHAVDRRDFASVRDCYHPDAYDDHGRYKGDLDGLIAYFDRLADRLHSTFHLMGLPYIVLKGDTAWVETFAFYRRDLREDVPVLQGLRYADRFERRDGEWRIAHRLVILDWEHAAGDAPPVPSAPEWLRGALRADDPAYALFQEARAATG